MPDGETFHEPAEAAPAPTSTTGGSASHLPWHLIPAFTPGETDLTEYSRRLEFLAGIWPSDHLSQLAPRAALACTGSAFQKVVRLQPEKLKVNSVEGVKLIVTTLGGVWGKTLLEDKYEKFEKAIYGVSQKSDESNESYVARHEILFEDLTAQGATLSDMRAYILLRNSALSSEDKKRVVIEAQGNLEYSKVTSAIRLLGAKFFHEVQGQQRQHRSKTYDVNHVQEAEDEVFHVDDHAILLAEGNELPESFVDQMLQEGDEDAFVMQQFEDALIDSLQGDGEMANYMSSYVEARKRLVEKSKSRGFWPVRPSKGSGKKGFKGKDGKGHGFRGRKPLAQRIAESDCKICGQRGHWKAECPRRATPAPLPPSMQTKTQPTNALIAMNDLSEDEADVFVVEASSSKNETEMQDVEARMQSKSSHPIFAVENRKHISFQKHRPTDHYDKTRKRVNMIIQETIMPQHDHRMIERERPETTPSCENQDGYVQVRPSRLFGIRDRYTGQPLTSFRTAVNNDAKPVKTDETVMFATSQAVGILDLGASQTVMGRHQVAEFLEELPPNVRRQVYEQPVEMTFRFGNNSVVPCDRAMFVPIDQFWIKIAIVESKTPFLISNNVCRSLGAIIDTSKQSVKFTALDCEIPLSLSSKRLFLLDFCTLATLRPPREPSTTEKKKGNSERVFACTEASGSQVNSDPINPNSSQTKVEVNSAEPNVVAETPQNVVSNDPISAASAILTSDPNADSPNHPCLLSSNSHHGQSCRALQCCEESVPAASPHRVSPKDEFRATGESASEIRTGQSGPEVQGDRDRRCPLLPMVFEKVWDQLKDRASGVHLLPDSMDRTSGARATVPAESQRPGDSQELEHQGKDWSGTWETFPELGPHRSGGQRVRGRPLGSSDPQGSNHLSGRDSEFQASGSNRECDARSGQAACCADAADQPLNMKQTLSASPEVTHLLQSSIDEFNAYVEQIGLHADQTQNPKPNRIWKEMNDFGKRHGYLSFKGEVLCSQKPFYDLLEVYCSSESQLTKQCIRQGMKAKRFGLREGDLGTFEGRCKLYHCLFQIRPRNIWLSPKCKAWCKWAQFNMMRSMSTAEKIVDARERDEVHLLLCDAIFRHQCRMGAHFHTHLEQPTGSEMLLQDPLQNIVDHTYHSRCDQCIAGNLRHPVNNLPIQKSTQILTTSMILGRYLDSLRCSHDHTHA